MITKKPTHSSTLQKPFRWTAIVSLMGVLLATALPALADPPAPVPLNSQGTVLFDKPNGKLILKTTVCLRDGLLEMFVCPKQTKEHESILSIDSSAQVIHAGLLALGAKPGKPAQFEPMFQPPSGPRVQIELIWKDPDGKSHRTRAQEWIRHSTHRYFEAPLPALPADVSLSKKPDELIYDDVKHLLIFFGPMTEDQQKQFLNRSDNPDYQKAVRTLFQQGQPRSLEGEFLFAGSGFVRNRNGREVYQAEGGSLICVANFNDAMIDINMQSSASNDAGLLFEAWTERIPPVGTEVLVELIPELEMAER